MNKNIIKIDNKKINEDSPVFIVAEAGYVNEEEQYNDEIKAFLDAIYGRAPYPFPFEENLENLKTLYKLEKGK